MYICPNCNTKTEEPANFCSKCGAQMVYVEPQSAVPQPPVQQYQPVQNYQPVYQEYQSVQKPHLATKIVGMVLSIVGLVFVAIGLLYTLIFLEVEAGASFAMALVFDLFFVPLSIIGLCLSNKCINAGDYSGMSRAGKITGVIGVILAAVALFIGFASLAAI